jgi:hypothetical protein
LCQKFKFYGDMYNRLHKTVIYCFDSVEADGAAAASGFAGQ